MQFIKPRFHPEHIKYLETVFPEVKIDPSDPMLAQKLLIREGEKRIISQIKFLMASQESLEVLNAAT